MNKVKSPLSDDARKVTGDALQDALVDLIDLGLVAKQAHWNLTGRNFRSVHLELDKVVEIARNHADLVAERAVAIGVNPDGRVHTVADSSRLGPLEAGYLQDDKVVAAMTDLLAEIIRRFRAHIDATDDADLVSQDLLIAATRDLEEQHWMFEVQRH
ncbi:DNA starvation/stationary phase protection protein [Actinoallomurus bryophytorum]|uniref:Starvation-inducible DNA-binding protein n=1 Tax=Actinoallomurus bryophytorum TaxID=1490222 RepID=A0A543CS36_9ACTN|nr:DNA starvation/stationary phase protection protein [Actinoallomurus bryophytorum]TQL99810.1 starvation-inducible DNA-binding protein [Actinoallomurus bryophytorum]